MPAPPLTHHEILGLVEPFARRGRHVDLAASDRMERRIALRPIEHAGAGADSPAMRETLELYSFGTGTFRLTRVLTLAGGLRASLEAMGPDPGALLTQIEAVELALQFRSGPGFLVARSYSIEPGAATPLLTRGVAHAGGMIFTLTLSRVRGVAADLTLAPACGRGPDLPEDLLAVLGWDWARLVRSPDGWGTRLRLRGDAATRSRRAELALDRAAAHLAATMAEAPGRFHDRWVKARWGVVLRRAIPLLTATSVLAAVAILPRLYFKDSGRYLMLFFHVPTVLIALGFCMQELPRFEIPPRPRRSEAPHWQPPREAPAAGRPDVA